MKQFFESIKDWTEVDGVEHELGKCFGLWDKEDFCTTLKHVFWTDNSVGNCLYEILIQFEKLGLIEYDRENLKMRSIDKWKKIVISELYGDPLDGDKLPTENDVWNNISMPPRSNI